MVNGTRLIDVFIVRKPNPKWYAGYLMGLYWEVEYEDEPDISERKEMNQKEIMELGKEMFWESQIELWNKKKEVEKRRWI